MDTKRKALAHDKVTVMEPSPVQAMSSSNHPVLGGGRCQPAWLQNPPSSLRTQNPTSWREPGTHILGEVGLTLGLKACIGLQQTEMQAKGTQVSEHAEIRCPRKQYRKARHREEGAGREQIKTQTPRPGPGHGEESKERTSIESINIPRINKFFWG